ASRPAASAIATFDEFPNGIRWTVTIGFCSCSFVDVDDAGLVPEPFYGFGPDPADTLQVCGDSLEVFCRKEHQLGLSRDGINHPGYKFQDCIGTTDAELFGCVFDGIIRCFDLLMLEFISMFLSVSVSYCLA